MTAMMMTTSIRKMRSHREHAPIDCLTPLAGWSSMETCTALDFGEMSRIVAGEARRHALVAPSFRSPPRLKGVTRTVRRYPNGQWLVAVRCRGRSVADVVADMVDGVLMANGLEGTAAEGWRITLRAACLPGQRRAA